MLHSNKNAYSLKAKKKKNETESVTGWYNRNRIGEKERRRYKVDNEDGVNWNGYIGEENEIRQEKFK